jgi:Tol biopolymer transport system component/DNA-binding winged helix-turn-helix (wHTH) protein
MLLERPGHVVTREEIQQRLWPEQTFVDFENSLNKAINKLRQALSDSAENPVYIETLPRRGYRFVGTLISTPTAESKQESALVVDHPSNSNAATLPSLSVSRSHAALWRVTGICIFLALAAFVWFASRPLPPPRVIRITQLTDSSRVDLYGGLHSDGVRLFFLIRRGHRWELSQMPVTGGEVQPFSVPSSTNVRIIGISPNGSQFAIAPFETRTSDFPLGLVSSVGGTPRRFGEFIVNDASFSPGGTKITYSNSEGIFEVGLDAQNPHKIVGISGSKWGLSWLPDGSRLRFHWTNPPDGHTHIWEVRSDGSQLHQILANWRETDGLCCGHWAADGKYFFFVASSKNLPNSVWVLREPYGLFHRQDPPVRLSTGPLPISNVLPTPDGKRLFLLGNNARSEYVRIDPKTHETHGLLGGQAAAWTTIAPTGDWAVYIGSGDALWRSNLDGSSQLELVGTKMQPAVPAISPDARSIAFRGQLSITSPSRIYIIPYAGGEPVELASSTFPLDTPAWSPDGKKVSYVLDANENPISGIYVLDLATRSSQKIPGSEKCWKHAWSPDGKYLSCVTMSDETILLYEFSTRAWSTIAYGKVFSPLYWSHDSNFLFFQDLLEEGEPVRRLRLKDRSVERIFDCSFLLEGGVQRCGLEGLSPDGFLVFQLSRGDHNVYSLDLDLP